MDDEQAASLALAERIFSGDERAAKTPFAFEKPSQTLGVF
jgi:hypothetical protein